MNDSEKCTKSILALKLNKNAGSNDCNNNELEIKTKSMLQVEYEFLNETRVLNISRPVNFLDLYQNISDGLNNSNRLLLHYTSPNKEIFGEITNQSELDHIVQCVDLNPTYHSLMVLVTTTTMDPSLSSPSVIDRTESPPPGCLCPNDNVHMERSTTFPISHVDGEFIPDECDLSRSQFNDSAYFSRLDELRGRREQMKKLTNIPLDPELSANNNLCSWSSPFARTEVRQSLPRLHRKSDPAVAILAAGRSKSTTTCNLDDELSSDMTNTPVKAPSLMNFKKGRFLGRGGFGNVFRCLDPLSGREFAMKEVLLHCENDVASKDVKSLENEIKIYSNMKFHPRIVQYFGTVREQSSLYIFLEFMTGGSVRDQITQYGPLSEPIVTRYTKQILQGLVFLHQCDIIHRDIKAANILRDIDCNVKLTDFGTSRYLKNISVHNSASGEKAGIKASTWCGTCYWMAPEVVKGDPYSFSADVWSLGATVVEMLTGNPPHHNMEPFAAIFKLANTDKVEYQLSTPINTQLQSLIDRMLVTKPSERDKADTLLNSDFLTRVPSD